MRKKPLLCPICGHNLVWSQYCEGYREFAIDATGEIGRCLKSEMAASDSAPSALHCRHCNASSGLGIEMPKRVDVKKMDRWKAIGGLNQ